MSRYHTTGRDTWAAPRAPSDPSLRRRKHGRILPMEESRPPRRARIVVIAVAALAIAAIYGAML